VASEPSHILYELQNFTRWVCHRCLIRGGADPIQPEGYFRGSSLQKALSASLEKSMILAA
jgi:hypothetical protein